MSSRKRLSQRQRDAARLRREIGRNKARARRQGKILAHGTTASYDQGCRCAPCRGAQARRANAARPTTPTWVADIVNADRLGRPVRPG